MTYIFWWWSRRNCWRRGRCLSTTAATCNTYHQSVKLSLCKKATICQVTTMLATSKTVLFPGHNYLLTTGTVLMIWHFNYHPHQCSGNNQSVTSSVPVVYIRLWPRNRTFLEEASMVVTWWIVAFSPSVYFCFSFIICPVKAISIGHVHWDSSGIQ